MSAPPTADLAGQRCYHHGHRVAAARCPACERFFCRECLAEHDDRVLCTACLRAAAAAPDRSGARPGVAGVLAAAGAFLALWFLFYGIGRALQAIPAAFHDGPGAARVGAPLP